MINSNKLKLIKECFLVASLIYNHFDYLFIVIVGISCYCCNYYYCCYCCIYYYCCCCCRFSWLLQNNQQNQFVYEKNEYYFILFFSYLFIYLLIFFVFFSSFSFVKIWFCLLVKNIKFFVQIVWKCVRLRELFMKNTQMAAISLER